MQLSNYIIFFKKIGLFSTKIDNGNMRGIDIRRNYALAVTYLSAALITAMAAVASKDISEDVRPKPVENEEVPDEVLSEEDKQLRDKLYMPLQRLEEPNTALYDPALESFQ